MANIEGTSNDDFLKGTAGIDTISGEDGNDRLKGLGGGDTLFGGAGDDVLLGGAGVDEMTGGTGDDIYYVTSEQESVFEEAGEGRDRVISYDDYFFLPANVEDLSLAGQAQAGSGNDLANIINGNAVLNVLNGNGANDTISGGTGTDALRGGEGDDWLRGGADADYLVGGAGRDRFVYYGVNETRVGSGQHDTIVDFHGVSSSAPASDRDRIDLHRIDADIFADGDQAFHFIGSGNFSGTAGELRLSATTLPVEDPTPVHPDDPQQRPGYLVQGDTNGDGVADFEIAVVSSTALFATDFFL